MHSHLHDICFVNVFYSFALTIILKWCKFKYSVLVGTHTLLDKSSRVLQLSAHLSTLTAKRQQRKSWLYSLECKLKRVGWCIHFWLFNDMNVWLESSTMLVNNMTNIFSLIQTLYYIILNH